MFYETLSSLWTFLTVDKMVLSSSRGTRVQTAPLVQDGTGPENDREVHSSPPVVSTKKLHSLSPLKYRLENIRLHKTDFVLCCQFFLKLGGIWNTIL